MAVSESEWLRRFKPSPDAFIEAAEVDLAQSLRAGATSPETARALMEQGDARIRGCVTWALNELTTNLSEYRGAVFCGLNDECVDVRYWCVMALQKMRTTIGTEAILHLFTLVEDDNFEVRCAVAETLGVFGRGQFEAAMAANPLELGLEANIATVIANTRHRIRIGYERFYGGEDESARAESTSYVEQLGYALNTLFGLAEAWRLGTQNLSASHAEIRWMMANEMRRPLEQAIAALRELCTDGSPENRQRAWLILDGIELEAEKWREMIPVALQDVDKRVHAACLQNLTHLRSRRLPRAVLAAAQDVNAGKVRSVALEALKHMIWRAEDALAIDDDSVNKLIDAVDNEDQADDIREDILRILRSLQAIATRGAIVKCCGRDRFRRRLVGF